jgi:MacB-like periplasmic core domain
MRQMLRNFQYAIRQLFKSPVFTSTAALTIALRIGANTAIFTVVYATLLAPMPYPKPDQLVMVWSEIQTHHNSVAAQDFVDWKNQSTAFEDLSAWSGGSFNLATKDEPEYLEGQFTTPGMYRMMGAPFRFGRDFLPEEGTAGKEHVVILLNKLWKRLGSDPRLSAYLDRGTRGRVVNLVLKEALVLALIGLGVGVVGSYFVGRAMQGVLFEVGKLDFGAIASVALVLLGASLVASWLPARRAAAVEPMRALRAK